ncbi:MAG: alpha/beta hydrolase-fold protein [Alphaproteobacteria bacterium]|nr:alpha/beta hydrolase-fold protein [Alphaproteobacteria bacterium]
MNKSPYKTLNCLISCGNEDILNTAEAENNINENTAKHECEDVKHVVILLHGYGSNAEDLISIAPLFKNMKDTLFVAPNAPYEIEGFAGNQWFPLITKENENGGFDVEISSFGEVKIASNLIIKLIEEIKEHHKLDSQNISLFGFSQGGILSLYTALNNDMQLGNVISHSGVYYGEHENENFNSSQKILMIHGEDDEVLPLEKFYLSIDYLKSHDIPFKSYVEKGLSHCINTNTIEICEKFLLKSVSEK